MPKMMAIRAARGFDGHRLLGDGVTVLVDCGRIVGVEERTLEPPDGWQVLDFAGATILPGLIDMHVHLCGDSRMGALDRLPHYSDDELDNVIEQALSAQLAAGITTVRDLGDRHWSVLEWRNRQRAGALKDACPMIVASGPPITSFGGHCWFMGGETKGRAALVAAVRERAERGVDVIKIMASGGMTTLGTDVWSCQFSLEELTVVIEESHLLGLPVVAHAHGLTAVEQAVAAGIDGIEHCTCATPTGIQTPVGLLDSMATRGVVVCPTLGLAEGWSPPPAEQQSAQVQHARRIVEQSGITPETRQAAVGRMHRAGVRLVSGADSGIGAFKPHGVLPMAIRDLVAAGVPAPEALASATSDAAEVCGLSGRKGRLAPGCDADLVVVDGNPFDDIVALAQLRAVFVDGEHTSPIDDAPT